MIRVLFSVLAVVVAVLAIVLEQPLLYAAAAVLVVVVVIIWLSVLRRRHQQAITTYKPTTTAPPLPEEDLKSLGIMEIRPKERVTKPPQDPAGTEGRTESPGISSARPVAPPPKPTAPLKEFVTAFDESEPPVLHVIQETMQETAREPEMPFSFGDAVLAPFLQSLRAALHAHTVCVLKQEDFAPDYEVIAHVSDAAARLYDAFSTETPLLTASMARHPVTVRAVDAGDLPHSHLAYYRTAPDGIRQVALAPVPRPSALEAYVLLADTTEADGLSFHRAQTLLTQFARSLGTLLDVPEQRPAPRPASGDALGLMHTEPPTSEGSMRPRREIIAEEMEQARNEASPLALALVYLNRAEAIADEGEAAVLQVEDQLEARLRQTTGHRRIERFGELTYGIFYDGTLLQVEAWGAEVQRTLSEETGLLQGGVSIGIAMLQDRHETADDFRADATEALREAYETGTCTILE